MEMDKRMVLIIDEQAAMRIRELEEVIEHLCHQFAYPSYGPSITTGGLSVLEEAFEALGWIDPHPVPERRCDELGCSAIASCGWPSDTGYRRTCGHHMPKEWK